jgi:ribosomal protein S18 acetylase RimI-like enzyme
MPTLRRLTAQDYEAVVDLWRRSGPPSIRLEGRDSHEAFVKQLQGGQIVIGLEERGKLIGVVVATHDTRKGWLNRLAIDPAHRRRGHGTTLHRAAEDALRRAGMQILAVLVENWNEPSLALLRKEGYKVESDILYLTRRSLPEA